MSHHEGETMTPEDLDVLDQRFQGLLQKAWDQGYAQGVEDATHGWKSQPNPYAGEKP